MQTIIKNEEINLKTISPNDGGQYFFGYYDLQPFDSTGRYHLCHRVAFRDRIPCEKDVCELGAIDLKSGEFVKFSETTAWNFQQGALLQWYKDDNHIIFNIREDNSFKSCVLNIKTGEKRILPMALANLSGDCKKALCVNFSRIYDFRKGYGYTGIPDPFASENAPKCDGVFLMDTETGQTKQILSYETIKNTFPNPPLSDAKLLVNHINFNPSGDRFVMLFRNFPKPCVPWRTQLLTSDCRGNLNCMANYAYHSHYHWKNDNELVIFGGDQNQKRPDGLYVFTDLENKAVRLPEPNPKGDIHCLYSPNRRYILGDGYPDQEDYRWLHLIDTKSNTDNVLCKVYSNTCTEDTTEYRCDLHARFDKSGRYVSFDTDYAGKRQICILDLADLKGYEY